MTTLMRHAVTYQGYQAKGVFYRRSIGLNPEPGWVLLSLEEVKKIDVFNPMVPGGAAGGAASGSLTQSVFWRPAGAGEMDAGVDIATWFNVKDQIGGSTAGRPPIQKPIEGGLNMFGNLVLKTWYKKLGQNWTLLSPIAEFTDVYVDDSGIEDMNEVLAEAKKHNQGSLYVPITDIRKFYKDYGCFIGRINCRLPGGDWDRTTLIDGGKRAATAQEVIRYLFHQLPGSPQVLKIEKSGYMDSLTLDPPTDIIGKGEPAVEHLEKVLDELGLVAAFLPNGHYLVWKKGMVTLPYNHIPHEFAESREGEFQHAESQTATMTYRPALVMVLGRKRIRRVTEKCVAVLEDEDGDIRPMTEVLQEWGYGMDKAMLQALVSDEKAFSDVAPDPTAGQDQAEKHYQRQELLRNWAFKGYAPVSAFTQQLRKGKGKKIPASQLGGLGQAISGAIGAVTFGGGPSASAVAQNLQGMGVINVLDPDRSVTSMLPMKDFAVYVSELSKIRRQIPKDEAKSGKGDLEKFAIIQPIVRAKRIGEFPYRDIKEVSKFFKNIVALQEDFIQRRKNDIAELERIILEYRDTILRASNYMPGTIEEQKINAEFFIRTTGAELVEFDGDVARLLNITNEFGVVVHKLVKEKMTKDTEFAIAQVKSLGMSIDKATEDIKSTQDTIKAWKLNFKSFEEAYKNTQAMGNLITNIPHMVVPEGPYTIDRELGVIMFRDVTGHMKRPFMLDTESPEKDEAPGGGGGGGGGGPGQTQVQSVGVTTTVSGSGTSFGGNGLISDGAVEVTYGYEYKTNSVLDYTAVLIMPKAKKPGGPNTPGGVAAPGFQAAITVEYEPVVVGISRTTPIKPKVERAPEMLLYEADMGTPINLNAVVSEALERASGQIASPMVSQGLSYVWSGLHRAFLNCGVSSVQYEWPKGGDGGTAHTTIAVNAPSAIGIMSHFAIMHKVGGFKAKVREITSMESTERRQ